jgi:hypothetical protein
MAEIYNRTLITCSVEACAMMGLGAATMFIERDLKCLDCKNLSEMVQTVAQRFSSADGDATYEGSRTLYEVSLHCCFVNHRLRNERSHSASDSA